MTNEYGTVDFDGQTITLTSQPEMTARLLETMPYHDRHKNDGDYNFEMSASGLCNDEEVTVYWIFENVEGAELDHYDYDDVDRVEAS